MGHTKELSEVQHGAVREPTFASSQNKSIFASLDLLQQTVSNIIAQWNIKEQQ